MVPPRWAETGLSLTVPRMTPLEDSEILKAHYHNSSSWMELSSILLLLYFQSRQLLHAETLLSCIWGCVRILDSRAITLSAAFIYYEGVAVKVNGNRDSNSQRTRCSCTLYRSKEESIITAIDWTMICTATFNPHWCTVQSTISSFAPPTNNPWEHRDNEMERVGLAKICTHLS